MAQRRVFELWSNYTFFPPKPDTVAGQFQFLSLALVGCLAESQFKQTEDNQIEKLNLIW